MSAPTMRAEVSRAAVLASVRELVMEDNDATGLALLLVRAEDIGRGPDADPADVAAIDGCLCAEAGDMVKRSLRALRRADRDEDHRAIFRTAADLAQRADLLARLAHLVVAEAPR